MTVSVRRALVTRGSRNASTPLLTASTPVMAVQPLANARSKIQSPTASRLWAAAGGGDHRRRMAAARHGGISAEDDSDHEAGDEQIGRHREQPPGSHVRAG